jgi:hypothetical protein
VKKNNAMILGLSLLAGSAFGGCNSLTKKIEQKKAEMKAYQAAYFQKLGDEAENEFASNNIIAVEPVSESHIWKCYKAQKVNPYTSVISEFIACAKYGFQRTGHHDPAIQIAKIEKDGCAKPLNYVIRPDLRCDTMF